MQNLFVKTDPQLSRGVDKNCQVCLKKFSIMLRQHQCKRCLKAVCSDCGNFRREVYSSGFIMRDHRVCKVCKDSSLYICQFINNNSMKFGEMSDIGLKWIKKITKKPSMVGIDTSKHSILTKQVFAELWDSYSFELRELVGVLTFKYEQSGIYDVVYTVYTTVISASSKHSIAQIIYLIIFVLCFCSSDKAAIIILYLLELKDNVQDLKNTAMTYLKSMPFKTEFSKIQNYSHYRYDKYFDSFLVNCLSIQSTIHLITKIMDRKNIQELLLMFSSHIFINKQILAEKCVANSRQMVDIIMLRNCILGDLLSKFKEVKSKQFSILTGDLRKTNTNINLSQQSGFKRQNTMQPSYNKETLSPLFQASIEVKNKPNFVKRQSTQYKDTIYNQDSFSIYLDIDEKQGSTKKSPPLENPSKNLLQMLQSSPKMKNTISEHESPFRKAINEQLTSEQLPQMLEMLKPIRKNIDLYDKTGIKNCERCQKTQEEVEKIMRTLSERQNIWKKEKQELEKRNQFSALKSDSLTAENYKKMNKINELESTKNSIQASLKQLQQKYKILEAKISKNQISTEQSKNERSKLNQKLMSETNDNIKLHASLQQQRRNVKQARQLVIQANKNIDNLNIKLTSSQNKLIQESKKQTDMKMIIQLQENDIQSLKRKLLAYEEGEKRKEQEKMEQVRLVTGKNEELKIKVNQYSNQIESKNAQIGRQLKQLEKQEKQIKKLNDSIKQISKNQLRKEAEYKAKDVRLQEIRDQLKQVKGQLNSKITALQSTKIILSQKASEENSNSKTNGIVKNENEQKRINLQYQKLELETKNRELNSVIQDLRLQIEEKQTLVNTNNQVNREYKAKIQAKNIQIEQFEGDIAQIRKQHSERQSELKKCLQKINLQYNLQTEDLNKVRKQLSLTQEQVKSFSQQNKNLKNQKQVLEKQLFEQHVSRTKEKQRYDQQTLELQNKVQLQRTMKDTVNIKGAQNNFIAKLNGQQRQLNELNISLTNAINENSSLKQRLTKSLKESIQIQQKNQQLLSELSTVQQKYQQILWKQSLEPKKPSKPVESEEITNLKKMLGEQKRQKQELLHKLSEISELMMQIQQEKMELSEQNFNFRQLLQQKGINWQENQ